MKLDLSVFDKNNKNYLQIGELNKWFSQSAPLLNEASSEDLLRIFAGLAELTIFDSKFIKNLCDVMSNKLSELSYSDLTSILYSLYELKYNKNLNFLQNIVINLTQIKVCNNKNSLVNSIWLLSKMEFYDEEFFHSWKIIATPKVNSFTNHELTKILQAIANLKLFDANFINLILNQIQNVITEFEPRTKLNIAFYLSVISVNSFNNEVDPLKIKINSVIQNIMQDIDLNENQDNIAKQQILQIHASNIYQVSEELFSQFSHDIKRKATITNSFIQKKVENYIRRVFLKYKVISEYYDQKTASHIDIRVVRDSSKPEYDVYFQVEGPTHYFINHQPHHDISIFNGATEYRNGLHILNSINVHAVSYFDIDSRSYYSNLLEILNSFPEGYSTIFSDENNEIKPEVSSGLEIKVSSIAKKSSKAKKKNHKIIQKEVVDNEDFDALLDAGIEFYKEAAKKELTFEFIDKKYRTDKKVGLSPRKLLEAAIKNQNLNEIEAVLKHYDSVNPGGLDDTWYIDNKIAENLYELTLNKISGDYKASQIYIEIYDLFLNYNYQIPELRENHLKALIYAFGYGKVSIFQNLLAIFPANDHKMQLMEYFMVNCGVLNHIEIVNLLLFHNVDINSCYSRESAEVLYALSIGYKHNGKTITNMGKAFVDLFKLLSGAAIIADNEQKTIEDLLQVASGGSFDRGDGILEGRGVTALHLSAYNKKNNAIALFLLENNASPNTINKDGFTPLITALLLGNEESALQILDFKPNVNLKALQDLTAAHIAAKYGFIEVIKRIADLGGDFDIKINTNNFISLSNGDGKELVLYKNETPLWIALKQNYIEIAKYLIDGKTNLDSHLEVNQPAYIGATILYPKAMLHSILSYCIFKHPELVKNILINGAKVNDNKIIENSPLIIAAELSNPDTQRRVAQNFKDPKYKEVFDKSIEFRKYHVFEQLLLYGADVNFKDKDGDTVSEYVRRPNMIDVHSRLVYFIKKIEYFTGYNVQVRHGIMSALEINVEISPDLLIRDSKYSIGSSTIFLESGDEESNVKSEKTYVSQLSVEAKITDIVVDTARLMNRPNMDIAYKLTYDISYLGSMLSGKGNPIIILVSAPHIANKIIHGHYIEAAIDVGSSIGLMLVNGAIEYMNIPIIKDLYPIAQEMFVQYQMLKNIELLYDEIVDPDNALKSAEAYQNVRDGFSNIFDSFQEMIGINISEDE